MQQGGLNEGVVVLEKQVAADVEEDLLPGFVYALFISGEISLYSTAQEVLQKERGRTTGLMGDSVLW